MTTDYIEKMAKATAYVEEHLRENISLEAVANAAALSPYHFHRIFAAVLGEPLGEYVRRRKLHEAAEELLENKSKIVDIALDHGFESHEGFTRSFKKVYGQSPAEFRRQGVRPVVFERHPVTKQMLEHYSQGIDLEPKLTVKPALILAGLEISGGLTLDALIKLWEKLVEKFGVGNNEAIISGGYGISDLIRRYDLKRAECKNNFSYFAGIQLKPGLKYPKTFIKIRLPKQLYAIFTHTATVERLEETYRYIYGTWLFRSGLELARRPDVQFFSEAFIRNSGQPVIEIWVPIKTAQRQA